MHILPDIITFWDILIAHKVKMSNMSNKHRHSAGYFNYMLTLNALYYSAKSERILRAEFQ